MRVKFPGGWRLLPLLAIPVLAADTRLIEAVKRADQTAIKDLIAKHVDVNAAEPDGTTALIWAAQADDLKIAELLLKSGANVKTGNRFGVTPLYEAATNGSAPMVDLFLKAGADANTALTEGETVLMTASRTGKVDAVKTLLVAGAKANAVEGWRGQTALMWASAENHPDVVKMLVEFGGDVKLRSNGGFTPFLFAVRAGRLDAVKALVAAGADVNDVVQAPVQPAMAAPGGAAGAPAAAGGGRGGGGGGRGGGGGGRGGAGAAGAGPGSAPAAAGAGQPGAGQAAGPAAAAGRGGGANSLGSTTGAAPPKGYEYISVHQNANQMRNILQTGNRGGGAGPAGTSALTLAITNSHYELAVWLLDHGANPNADAQGWTPLHQLVWTRRPSIQHNLPPPEGLGNMDSMDVAKALLAHGADINARVKKEINDGNRNVMNRVGATAFLLAAKSADVELMKFLLANHADVTIMTTEHANALMAAAGVGIWHVGESPGSNEEAFEAVKICYDAGITDVNVMDDDGETAIHGGAYRGSPAIVKFLAEKGAKLDLENATGWTPLRIADGVLYPNTFNREPETYETLRKLGAKSMGVDIPKTQ